LRYESKQLNTFLSPDYVVTKGYDTVDIGTNQVGDDRPNWRSLVKDLTDATNAYNARFISVKGGQGGTAKGTWITDYGGFDYAQEDSKSGWLGVLLYPDPPTVSSSAINRAKGAFAKKAAQKISPFAGGVFLGELAEAVRMMKSPAKALFDSVLYQYLPGAKRRKRKNKDPKKARKAIAELWLEHAFGWQPLIGDVKAGAETLSRLVNDFRPSEGVQVTIQDTSDVFSPIEGAGSQGNVSWRYNVSVVDEVTVRLKGAVRMAPQDTLRGNLDVLGLDWTSVIPTLWELIPMSFVTDYFSNVGDIITSACQVQSRLVWAAMVERRKRIYTYDGFSDTSPTNLGPTYRNFKTSVSAGKVQVTVTDFVRTRVPSIVPSLQFECPGVGSLKWLNLAALYNAVTS
jgi:hypothetical protein